MNDDVLQIKSVAEHDHFYHKENYHPLVSIMDFDGRFPKEYASKMSFDFYAIYLKEVHCGDFIYGKNTYDYQDKTLVFVAPHQIINVNINADYRPQGYALLFHPDLLLNTPLGKHIEKYSFFSYQTNEALHISEKEREIVLDCFRKISYEIENERDSYSDFIIVDIIELFLNYCMRFYDRQFQTRKINDKDFLSKFEKLLNDYFQSDKAQLLGIPSVGYFADNLHFSTNYFSDLIKKTTGKTVLEYIHLKIIEIAKQKLSDKTLSVGEISYQLGFRYAQHFSRFFKNHTGKSPNKYR